MRIYFSWLLVLLTTLLCASLSVVASTSAGGDLDDICSTVTIEASGIYAKFNSDQCKRAHSPLRTLQPQTGDTCTCEALLNVAFELGVSGTLQDFEKTRKCNGGNFGALFGDYAASTTPFAGRVFGGLIGAYASKSLHSTDAAMREIVGAVSDGHVVAVGLDAKPIYDDYAATHNVSYSFDGFSARHALVVRAVIRIKSGEISHFVLLDSSGPERLYTVPYAVFKKAYGALGARISDRKSVV